MKRLIFVLLLAAAACSGHAQSLQLSNIHGVIAPNAIIIQAGTPDSLEMITYLNVKNIGTGTMSVYCKKSELSMLDSTQMTMCWADGCYPPDVNVSPSAKTIQAGETITDFVGHYSQIAYLPFMKGESVIRWVFYDAEDDNDSMSVTIKYTSYPVGVEETTQPLATLSNASPNPASAHASFSYFVPSGSVGEIIIRNVLGSTIHSEKLPSGHGTSTINTTNLSNGIYFYSLLVDGKLCQSKRLIVKH